MQRVYEKSPALAIRRPKSPDLSLNVILSDYLNLCSIVSYQAKMELLLFASTCFEKWWKSQLSSREERNLEKCKVQNRFNH